MKPKKFKKFIYVKVEKVPNVEPFVVFRMERLK